MFKNITKYALTIFLLLLTFSVAHADDTLFSTNLYAKFQVKACTTCHDFYEQSRGSGLLLTLACKTSQAD
jgi:hypothetical protein